MFTYYKISDSQWRYYDGKKVKTLSIKPIAFRDDKNLMGFQVFKGFDKNKQGLKSCYDSIIKWNDELTSVDNDHVLNFIGWDKIKDSNIIINKTFFDLCPLRIDKMPHVNAVEYRHIEACYNGALLFIQPYEGYGTSYDYKAFYPFILGSKRSRLEMPISTPRTETLTELPAKIPYGIYRCMITFPDYPKIDGAISKFPISKVFRINFKHYYTHYDIQHVINMDRFYGIRTKIELIQDGEPNAMIYDKTVRCRDVFGEWYDKLTELKNKYPKNKLVKDLLSGLWGRLCQQQKMTVTREEASKMGRNVHILADNEETLVVRDENHGYHFQIARLKPFLMAQSRKRMGEALLKANIFDIVTRVHTDGFTVKGDVKLNIHNCPVDEKQTGYFKWTVINKPPQPISSS